MRIIWSCLVLFLLLLSFIFNLSLLCSFLATVSFANNFILHFLLFFLRLCSFPVWLGLVSSILTATGLVAGQSIIMLMQHKQRSR